jgi:hypothetical protein
VSFKVEAAELFWTQLRSLPVLVQEQVLDLVEELLDDPRGQTDRGIALPINAVATRLTLIEVGSRGCESPSPSNSRTTRRPC